MLFLHCLCCFAFVSSFDVVDQCSFSLSVCCLVISSRCCLLGMLGCSFPVLSQCWSTWLNLLCSFLQDHGLLWRDPLALFLLKTQTWQFLSLVSFSCDLFLLRLILPLLVLISCAVRFPLSILFQSCLLGASSHSVPCRRLGTSLQHGISLLHRSVGWL